MLGIWLELTNTAVLVMGQVELVWRRKNLSREDQNLRWIQLSRKAVKNTVGRMGEAAGQRAWGAGEGIGPVLCLSLLRFLGKILTA